MGGEGGGLGKTRLGWAGLGGVEGWLWSGEEGKKGEEKWGREGRG